MIGAEIGAIVLALCVWTVLSAMFGSMLFDRYWEYRRALAQYKHEIEMKKIEAFAESTERLRK